MCGVSYDLHLLLPEPTGAQTDSFDRAHALADADEADTPDPRLVAVVDDLVAAGAAPILGRRGWVTTWPLQIHREGITVLLSWAGDLDAHVIVVLQIAARYGLIAVDLQKDVVHWTTRKKTPAPREELLAAWRALSPTADVWSAFATIGDAAGGSMDWSLPALREALLGEDGTDAQVVELCERAFASPHCVGWNSQWRAWLVEAYVRVGRLDEARREISLLAAHLYGFDDTNWVALIAYLDAVDRQDDADAIWLAARRYVAGWDKYERTLIDPSDGAADVNAPANSYDDENGPRASETAKARAAQVLLELTSPLFAVLSALDDNTVDDLAYSFRTWSRRRR
jgi:hypothetical protein